VFLSAGVQVPFLSVGGELGWREVVSRGASELSGEYCVEDVRGEDGELYRRLVFLSNAGLVQSEGRLVSATPAGRFSSADHDAVALRSLSVSILSIPLLYRCTGPP